MNYEIHPQVRIGHIHLTVSNLERAVKFYTEMLGFSVTARFGDTATFLSSGNDHHHIGLNTWAGENASTPPPGHTGLYRSAFEHDNCGIGFVAHLKGKKSHDIIKRGLETLVNMTHRGAEGADSKTGDGAGVLIQVPRDFYLIQGYSIPPEGQFGTGIIFLPQDSSDAERCLSVLTDIIKEL